LNRKFLCFLLPNFRFVPKLLQNSGERKVSQNPFKSRDKFPYLGKRRGNFGVKTSPSLPLFGNFFPPL
jgi:hypothetical protein